MVRILGSQWHQGNFQQLRKTLSSFCGFRKRPATHGFHNIPALLFAYVAECMLQIKDWPNLLLQRLEGVISHVQGLYARCLTRGPQHNGITRFIALLLVGDLDRLIDVPHRIVRGICWKNWNGWSSYEENSLKGNKEQEKENKQEKAKNGFWKSLMTKMNEVERERKNEYSNIEISKKICHEQNSSHAKF